MKARPFLMIGVLILLVSACQTGVFSAGSQAYKKDAEFQTDVEEEAVSVPTVETPPESLVSKNIPTEPAPTMEPEVLNPLTGLPVQNPGNLALPPALVSVTNFPPTARPQAGLSFSPLVFELYIGDGMTRYLAVFYGDYPKAAAPEPAQDAGEALAEGVPPPTAEIGPIRSGRLPYEYIRKLYNGFIVMASAYSKVAAQLDEYVNVFGSDTMDVNSALIPVDRLEDIARASQDDLGGFNLSGMAFDAKPPAQGKTAHSLWVFYAFKNQVFWRYNAEDGAYHRWQDNADGSTFIEQTDRLNGEPLTYENVIVLFADHEVENTYLIDINLLYVKKGKALLFRDGLMQEIYWTTKSEEYEQTTGDFRPIRFIDADGNPVLLKPGQTWVEIVPGYTVYWETVNSEKYNQLVAGRSKGSGYWGLYFDLED
jgi:hypothetical protein